MTEALPRSAGRLTTRQGHPVENDQNSRTIGARGPATLENYHLIEKISHFDRERIPERVVHARGFLAHGTFTPTGRAGDEPITTYTRAKVFTEGTSGTLPTTTRRRPRRRSTARTTTARRAAATSSTPTATSRSSRAP